MEMRIIEVVVEAIISVFIAFLLIKTFSDAFPGFGQYAWPILAALVLGVILFFRYGLFELIR
jgi:uncharacterized membrane protein